MGQGYARNLICMSNKYDCLTVDELERLLDEIVEQYKSGAIGQRSYSDEYQKVYSVILKKNSENKAYERAMRGI
jgi:hypothetical protein